MIYSNNVAILLHNWNKSRFRSFFLILLLYNNHKILIFFYAIIWAKLYSAKIETQFVNDRIIRKTATEYI